MPSKRYCEKLISLETPAIYRIRVKGHLDSTWSDRLAGMDITSTNPEDNGLVTTLVGSLCDQAELVGVLNSLYQLHMPLLTVEVLKSGKADDMKVLNRYDLQKERNKK